MEKIKTSTKGSHCNNISIVAKNLKNEKVFVCYNSKKQPINPYNSRLHASVADNNTWSYFEQSYNTMLFNDDIEGIGVVFGKTAKGNLAGLDIDNCIDDEGNLSKLAIDLITLLDTYTEISKSGHGIHCLFYAEKLGNTCKINNITGCKQLELYDNAHYFALTGNTINKKSIEHRQEQCNEIYNKYFTKKEQNTDYKYININDFIDTPKEKLKEYYEYITKIANTNNVNSDLKLIEYWHGTSKCNDESYKDLALMGKLAYYTNCNASLMKDLALMSPYFAMKDKKHKDKWLKRKDYLLRTIEIAINNNRRYC